MQLIRLVVCTVVMGSMINTMAMEKEVIKQKRAAAVAKYKEIKKLIFQYQKNYFTLFFTPKIVDGKFQRVEGRLQADLVIDLDYFRKLPPPDFDEECIQDLSLVQEKDSQKEKDKALRRLMNICNYQFYTHYRGILKKSIKTVVQKGADPNLENDTKYAGYPLYKSIEEFNKEKNDDLLQFLFAHGAHTNLKTDDHLVCDAFEEYNKNQERLKNESINN